MAKRDVLSLLDEYERLGLDKILFQSKLHHLGSSFHGFYKFAAKVHSFRPLECNQLLQDRLAFLVKRVQNGAPHNRAAIEKLIEQSFIEIPCSRYPNCKGHKFDPDCKHRK